ncbi:MAG: adenylate cyclase [Mycobacterium sp.]|nr:adenylate cyclase [Mycobacterium sp.]
MRCPACGTTALRDAARFCDSCGASLGRVDHSAEYKQVTILFADVVRSMDIAAALGPERLRELMTELVECSGVVVRRYGGMVNQFTGDGFMALFGAPLAMEDHAVRACLAALDIQAETQRLATEFERRYEVELKMRIGLNSGEVVAGDIGSGPMAYTVTGRQVGMAQRMESAAPPGGVMLSESTSRLVEQSADLDAPEPVRIKGSDAPVTARRLLAINSDHLCFRRESPLVGRDSEMTSMAVMLDEAIHGHGRIVGIAGPPGIGKSRLAREASAMAANQAVPVIPMSCESHFKDIPFHAAASLLRGFFGVGDLQPEAARAKTRAMLPDTDPHDIGLLDDLLGISDAEPSDSGIVPDARRRRLSRILNGAMRNRREPTLFIIEDAHWMDLVSESILAEFLSAVPQTPVLVLVTYRPEYRGALTGTSGGTGIWLSPLGKAGAATLTARLLGSDASVAMLAEQIAERSAGNPFFTEEIVRDLAERGIIGGERGAYVSRSDGEVAVPVTVQATIAARIDRLDATAKSTLTAASVIGSRFGADILGAVIDRPALAELVDAELIEPVSDAPSPEYAFRHPLLRAVAYESQLKSGRATLHRKIAAAIEARDPDTVETNAALIGTHVEAAGDLRSAFGWHMRAGAWSTRRDISAARMSWQRAAVVADQLRAEDRDRLAKQIAPRTLLCATIWRAGGEIADSGFDELRELTTAADDKQSLAMAMTGQVQMLSLQGKFIESARLASEFVDQLESIDVPELSVGLLIAAVVPKWSAGQITEAMRLCEKAIRIADGNPKMGSLIIGSPLATMLALRGTLRCCSGIPGWQRDFDDAVAMARSVDQFSFCTVVQFKYIAILNWALEADDEALHDTAESLEIARQGADDFTLANAEFAHGSVLVRRDDTDREHGFQLLANAARMGHENHYTVVAVFCFDLDLAAERTRNGDLDGAIELSRNVLESQIRTGEMMNRGWSTTILVEALLRRGADGDIEEAQAAIDRLAATPTDGVYLFHELPLLKLNALLARARGDDDTYRTLRDRYRTRAEETGLRGHIASGRAMH